MNYSYLEIITSEDRLSTGCRTRGREQGGACTGLRGMPSPPAGNAARGVQRARRVRTPSRAAPGAAGTCLRPPAPLRVGLSSEPSRPQRLPVGGRFATRWGLNALVVSLDCRGDKRLFDYLDLEAGNGTGNVGASAGIKGRTSFRRAAGRWPRARPTCVCGRVLCGINTAFFIMGCFKQF